MYFYYTMFYDKIQNCLGATRQKKRDKMFEKSIKEELLKMKESITTKYISFFNDGVLMPLDDLNEKYLSYYNIKSKYLINYKDDRYLISSKF